jgi:RND family efflux transporter MFP subunit
VNAVSDPKTQSTPARTDAPALPVSAVVPRSRGSVVLMMQSRALGQERFAPAATAVVNELALLLGCERVSIGFHAGGKIDIGAISNTADVRQRQSAVRAIADAMQEALEQRALIIYPVPRGSAAHVSLAHAALAKQNGNAAICTVPFIGRQRAFGALVFERRAGFDAQAIELAKDAAMFVAPILELKHRLDSPLGGRIVEAIAPRGRRLAGIEFAPWKIGAIATSIAALMLAIWPSTYRVVAPARIEGSEQRVIAAPVDGFVQKVTVRPGETVKEGQVLVALEDQDLALEREKWDAEAAQLDKQYREALSKDDAAQIVIARSKLEQANAQYELALRQLERAQLKAPFDGVVLSGDLTQSIGMPVKRGQELLTVAPDKSFRVVAEVDEQDVSQLKVGQSSNVMFAGLSSRPVTFKVSRVAPVATTLEGRNVFEVEGHLAGADASLRAGLRGVAKIDVDQRSLGSVWWTRASNWARRTWWRVVG